MTTVLRIAADLLREAAARKWFLALGLGITAVLVTLGFALRMEVVDGALSASKLFGFALGHTIRSADVALRPVFMAATFLTFYGGILFGIVACADFAPQMLSPGRIEHLLSLPVRRWQLLIGTFIGVMVLALAGSLYGSAGITLILGVKTGVWTWKPIVSALLCSLAFGAVYAVMLLAALFVRSAALSAAAGMVLFVLGIVAGNRNELAPLFEEGLPREIFRGVTAMLPRLSTLSEGAAQFAAGRPIEVKSFESVLIGVGIWAAGALLLGIYRFEQKDF